MCGRVEEEREGERRCPLKRQFCMNDSEMWKKTHTSEKTGKEETVIYFWRE